MLREGGKESLLVNIVWYEAAYCRGMCGGVSVGCAIALEACAIDRGMCDSRATARKLGGREEREG